MEKERVWIFAIIIAFTIGVCVMLKYQQMKTGTISQSHNESVQETEMAEEKDDNPLSEESKNYFKSAGYLTIEKVERTVVEDATGNSMTSYDSYYVSDVDLRKQTDLTEDYSKALAGEKFDDTLIETIDFAKAFDVNYQNMNGWEIYKTILVENGIDGDIENTTFDEETNQLTGQKLYVVEDPGNIIGQMIQGESGEVLNQKVFYQSIETTEGISIPDYFSAVVQYQLGNQKVTKSIYLQVSVNQWEEESHEAN